MLLLFTVDKFHSSVFFLRIFDNVDGSYLMKYRSKPNWEVTVLTEEGCRLKDFIIIYFFIILRSPKQWLMVIKEKCLKDGKSFVECQS